MPPPLSIKNVVAGTSSRGRMKATLLCARPALQGSCLEESHTRSGGGGASPTSYRERKQNAPREEEETRGAAAKLRDKK